MYDRGLNNFPQEYPGESELDSLDREIDQMRRRRKEVLATMQQAMDPKDERLVELAHEAGRLDGAYRAVRVENRKLNEKNEKLEEEVGYLKPRANARDTWKERAEAAEAKLKKRRKR